MESSFTPATLVGRFLALVLALITGLALLALPSPAQAAGPYITQDANVRSCTNTANANCAPFARISARTAGELWSAGATSPGPPGPTPRTAGFLVRRASDGFEGFVHSSQVGGQELAPRAPHCGSVPRVKAGLGRSPESARCMPTPSDAALFTDWAPGPYGEWSGDCKKLVNVAWYRATGVKLVSGNAKPTFDYYWARRSYKGWRQPGLRQPGGLQRLCPYGHHRGRGWRQPHRDHAWGRQPTPDHCDPDHRFCTATTWDGWDAVTTHRAKGSAGGGASAGPFRAPVDLGGTSVIRLLSEVGQGEI